MMHYFRNILFFSMAIILPFASLNAQHKKKKKAAKASSHSTKTKTHHGNAKPLGVGFKRTTSAAPQVNKSPLEIMSKKEEPVNVTLVHKDTTTNPTPVDTTSSATEVVIMSSFKPSLRNAAKINFTAATPVLDTTKFQLNYTIPSQNLFFSYQPIPIKPLALAADSGFVWEHQQYLKAGFGNYSSPYLEAGASFGNGVASMITAHGKYVAAKGSLLLQQYSKAGIDLLGNFTTQSNLEITSKAYWEYNSVYQYGYQPANFKIANDSLHQKFNTFGIEAGLENRKPTVYGVTYHPQLQLNHFSNTSTTTETNLLIKAPISKAIGRLFTLNLAAILDVTHYTNRIVPDTVTINNNLFNFNTSLQFNTPNFKLNLGLLPSWDNGQFSLLPNFTGEGKLANNKLVVEGGWIGYYQKNTYKSLAGINPFIAPPTTLFNTKTTEEYVGVKSSIGKQITYNARLSFLKMINVALFLNDTTTRKTQNFLVLNEPSIQALRLKGEISYAVQENLAVLASATYTQFTKLSVSDKAYGLLPLEISGALRWKMFNDLTIKSELFIFGGSNYLSSKLESNTLKTAYDANVGAEFPIMKKLNAWVQFNNLLNNRYQRWNQYEVLGFQLLAGVVYSFR